MKESFNASGIKDSADKPRYDLLMPEPIDLMVQVLTYGAKKYVDYGWQNVSNPQSCYYSALMRHLMAYRRGEYADPESGLPHTAHAAACIHFMQWHEYMSDGGVQRDISTQGDMSHPLPAPPHHFIDPRRERS